MLKCNSSEVEKDASFLSASEDKVLDLGNFFGNSECEKEFGHAVVDDETYSCPIGKSQLKISTDSLVTDITHEEDNANKRFLYEMLSETDDGVFHGNKFPSIYEDSLLDVKPAHALFDSYYGPDEASCLVGSHSADLKEKDLGSLISRACPGSGVKVESLHNNDATLLDQMKDHDLHEAFRSILGCETGVENTQWLKNCILFRIKNRVELGSLVNQLECSEFAPRNEDIMVSSSAVESCSNAPDSFKRGSEDGNMPQDGYNKENDTFKCDAQKAFVPDTCADGAGSLGSDDKECEVVHKRMRKPTKRYLEHSLELKTRCFYKKCKISNKGSRNEELHPQSRKQNHQQDDGEMSLASVDRSSDVGFIQVPFGSPVDDAHSKEVLTLRKDMEVHRKERQLNLTKKNSVKCSSNEPAQVISKDLSQASNKNHNGKTKRKHHIMWSLSEVMKLVEGVSKYGIGRWTEIKKLMFPSSSRRTSVDIKDKWRNLLKASGIKLQSKGKVHHGQKKVSHQVPESVLCRVRELAGMQPSPKGQKSKVSASY